MKSVAIRVDSSQVMGSGHLMRCLTLAERLRCEGTDVRFICRDLVGNPAHLAREKGFALELLPRREENSALTGYTAWLTVSQETDATETIAALERAGRAFLDRLIIDHYAIDEVWEKHLRPYTKEIFVIDDLANRRHDCDVLLDQNFYRHMQHRYDGLVPTTCRLLLGPQYALLREEFYRVRETMRVRDGSLRRILVFYGGSDLTSETERH